MSQDTLFKEELELDQIRETQQQLQERKREFAENQKRIARERAERESMMPPLDEIQIRRSRKEHESNVNRGVITNARRTQNRSIVMLLLLVMATASLIWWGVRLMQGS
jgi:hypothetical protein